MNTEIYYFSGTGNSLAVARDLAEKVGATLISIPSVIDRDRITTDAEAIGIVFPVYYGGILNIPVIVQRFVAKLDNPGNTYIFAVCTYGGGAGPTLEMMDRLLRLRGGRLAAGFGVHMPQNAFSKPFENRDRIFKAWKTKELARISGHIRARSRGYYDADGLFVRSAFAVIQQLVKRSYRKTFSRYAGFTEISSLPIEELVVLIDNSYTVDENCTGCRICSKVCPVHNIQMINDRPSWQHRCENCLACVKWCPKKAIHNFGESPRGYHHPEVTLTDIMAAGPKE